MHNRIYTVTGGRCFKFEMVRCNNWTIKSFFKVFVRLCSLGLVGLVNIVNYRRFGYFAKRENLVWNSVSLHFFFVKSIFPMYTFIVIISRPIRLNYFHQLFCLTSTKQKHFWRYVSLWVLNFLFLKTNLMYSGLRLSKLNTLNFHSSLKVTLFRNSFVLFAYHSTNCKPFSRLTGKLNYYYFYYSSKIQMLVQNILQFKNEKELLVKCSTSDAKFGLFINIFFVILSKISRFYPNV